MTDQFRRHFISRLLPMSQDDLLRQIELCGESMNEAELLIEKWHYSQQIKVISAVGQYLFHDTFEAAQFSRFHGGDDDSFTTTPAKIAMEHQEEVRDLTEQGTVAAAVRCPECGEPVPSIFEHIDQDCTAGRKLEPVDLGYTLFCAVRCVEHNPLGWLKADKEPWIKAAQEFMRMAGLKQ